VYIIWIRTNILKTHFLIILQSVNPFQDIITLSLSIWILSTPVPHYVTKYLSLHQRMNVHSRCQTSSRCWTSKKHLEISYELMIYHSQILSPTSNTVYQLIIQSITPKNVTFLKNKNGWQKWQNQPIPKTDYEQNRHSSSEMLSQKMSVSKIAFIFIINIHLNANSDKNKKAENGHCINNYPSSAFQM
jgi:hypothetical protein